MKKKQQKNRGVIFHFAGRQKYEVLVGWEKNMIYEKGDGAKVSYYGQIYTPEKELYKKFLSFNLKSLYLISVKCKSCRI